MLLQDWATGRCGIDHQITIPSPDVVLATGGEHPGIQAPPVFCRDRRTAAEYSELTAWIAVHPAARGGFSVDVCHRYGQTPKDLQVRSQPRPEPAGVPSPDLFLTRTTSWSTSEAKSCRTSTSVGVSRGAGGSCRSRTSTAPGSSGGRSGLKPWVSRRSVRSLYVACCWPGLHPPDDTVANLSADQESSPNPSSWSRAGNCPRCSSSKYEFSGNSSPISAS